MTRKFSKVAATSVAALAALALAACSSATAPEEGDSPAVEFPTDTITIIVPYSAGGVTDLAARVIAEGMTAELGETVIVENKPGANGLTGSVEVALAKPDGYTLLFSADAAINQSAFRGGVPYTMDHFEPLESVFMQPYVLVVPKNSPITSFADVEALSSATYAVTSIGGQTHTNGALLFEQLGIDATEVPFDGSAPAIQAIVGGQTDLFIGDMSPLMPFIESGDLRAIAVLDLGATLPDALKDVPTLSSLDIDVSEMAAPIWGFAAPEGIDPAIVTIIRDAMRTAIDGQTFVDFAAKNYYPLLEGDAQTGWWDTVRSNGAITAKVLADLGVEL